MGVIAAAGSCALLMLALSASAAAAEDEPEWEVSAAGQAGFAGDMSGFGAVIHGLWIPHRAWAVGAIVDVTQLGGRGDRAANGDPYRVSLLSTYVGAVGQLRLALGAWTPFLELGLGGVAVSTLENVNNQCSTYGGFTPSAALGVNVLLSQSLALGVRGGGRFSSAESGCTLVGQGPAALTPDSVLLTAAAGLRWSW